MSEDESTEVLWAGRQYSFTIVLKVEGITTGLGRQGRFRKPWLAGELALLLTAGTG